MFKKADERFEIIRQKFIDNGSSVDMIEKAYNLAKLLHKDQKRKDGQPYISHPVEVAIILSRLDFDEEVISGALLHDVVEDCGFTLEQIAREFNNNVAQMVDCVSAIDHEKYIFNKNDVFEDEDFEKASIEEQSFKKLIAIGKENPLGFCIKFADRLHNLSTIESFDYNKQLEKVKETEKWIIPIAKILNSEYFYRELKNECFKIVHRFDGQHYLAQYNAFHELNTETIKDIKVKFNDAFSTSYVKQIIVGDVKEYKVFEDLSKMFKNLNIAKISQGQILKVTNYNIYLLYENENYNEIISDILNRISNKIGGVVKIIDARVGNFTKKPYYQLEDKYKNKFNLYVMSKDDYYVLRNGTLDGRNSQFIDEDNIDTLGDDLIRVYTKSGDSKFVAAGSSVLDVAFKIHKDLGLGFKYAIINDSKTKVPPYSKVYEGDKIEIVVDRDEGGKIIKNASLKWFAYVNSDLAKKCLIKEFEKKMQEKK